MRIGTTNQGMNIPGSSEGPMAITNYKHPIAHRSSGGKSYAESLSKLCK